MTIAVSISASPPTAVKRAFTPRAMVRAAWALVALAAWCVPAALCAQDDAASDAQAVEAGREALSRIGRMPWYDRSQDDVRRLQMQPRADADSENRESKWTRSSPAASQRRTGRQTSRLGPVLQWLGVTALILLLGVIAFLIAKAFLKEEVSDSAVARKVVEAKADLARVEALPFQVRKPTGDLLSEARRLYEAGNYSEAIIYLFSHELVELDRHHLIRLAKGKTNRQYVREIRQRPTLRSILELTMFAFEDVFFGGKTISRERFEACWNRMDEFRGELERTQRAAA